MRIAEGQQPVGSIEYLYDEKTKKGSGRYRAIAWNPRLKKKERLGTFEDENEAQAAIDEREAQIDRIYADAGVSVKRNQSRCRFDKCAAEWLAAQPDREKPPAKNTVASYVVSVRVLTKTFGQKLLHEITGGQVDDFLLALRKAGRSPGTRKIRLGVLRQIVRYGIGKGYLRAEDDPTAGREVTVPKRSLSKSRILDEDELARAVSFLPEWFRPGALLAYDCGLRECEVAGLRWRDLDLRNPQRAAVYVTGIMDRDGVPREGTKGNDDEGFPAIPLWPRTALALIELRKSYPGEGSDFVFRLPTKSGRVLFRPQHIGRMWRKARALAGLDDDQPHKSPVRFHDLRHAYGTNLAWAGKSPWVIKDGMRHGNVKTSEGYIRRMPLDLLREEITGVPRLRIVGDS